MYKNIIKRIHTKVQNKKNKKLFPRVIDYVDAVIADENKNFFDENDEIVVNTKRESIRRSVAKALQVLEEQEVLGKIGMRYVSRLRYLEYHAWKELLKKHCLRNSSVIKVLDNVFVLPLDAEPSSQDSNDEKGSKRKSYLYYYEREFVCKCEEGEVLPDREWPEDIDVLENIKKINIDSELDKGVGALRQEVILLTEAVKVLSRRYEFESEIENIAENLQNFLADICCVHILNINKNIIIIADNTKKQALDKVYNKLERLLSDVKKADLKVKLRKK